MARVELTISAVEDLHGLARTYSLPADTTERAKRSLRSLESFPRIGRELSGAWEGCRFILGPWRWLVFVYQYDEDADVAVVITLQDARSSRSATGG